MLKFNPWRSMTLQGTVAAVAPYLVNSLDIAALSPKTATVVSLVGVVWGMLGLRNAVEKAAGKAVADLTEKMLQRAGGR